VTSSPSINQAQAPSGITPEVMKQDILNFMNSMAGMGMVDPAAIAAGSPAPLLSTKKLGLFPSIREESNMELLEYALHYMLAGPIFYKHMTGLVRSNNSF
jgi:hypothetical protein